MPLHECVCMCVASDTSDDDDNNNNVKKEETKKNMCYLYSNLETGI